MAATGLLTSIPIRLIDLTTGELINDAYYRSAEHHYNAGRNDTGCVYIRGGHELFEDDKFYPERFYVDAEQGVLVGKMTACVCGTIPCKRCAAYLIRERQIWWSDPKLLQLIVKSH
jgi:hypothetical protein